MRRARTEDELIHGFGLDQQTAFALLMEPGGYNVRCVPPWSAKEWKHHLANAAANGHAVSFINGATIDVAKKASAFESEAPQRPYAIRYHGDGCKGP
jgi:hypothetical protein